MLGVLLSDQEVKEVEFVLKRELEEILLDLSDPRIDEVVKLVMEEKYEIIYGIYKRFGTPEDKMKYVLPKTKRGYK
ncbi:hypothetical protein [Alkalihalobacillus trypoxylicola]|uniref:Uncharacterized protein n=1 Tax=Alkalihalobacillus trypoxylicola TaxID=519424 RepID=A0A161PKB9_9BACI|nr:hypothetical protein [Alkalihalobacillus trypoxylicola]KYG33869.1 hypothetical protein AZF04_15245 [Alkalihalobacillus trypoxylicola]GAF66253.1 hypothetical protein BTS2_3153 [Bacillus sp. TS-2]